MVEQSGFSERQKFIDWRLLYYSELHAITPNGINSASDQLTIDKLRALKPDLIVLTSTKDRIARLHELHESLVGQKGETKWAWLVVDNLSKDNTQKFINNLKDDRVFYTECSSQLNCAYPVRNRGLDLISETFWAGESSSPLILNIDSDDSLHNMYSIFELMKIWNKSHVFKDNLALVHGYSDTVIYSEDGSKVHFPNPRDTSSTFPKVESLSETLYKGLNILAGAFPIEILKYFRYPKEKSFEDGGFNEKLMLYAVKNHMKWLYENYPITVKNFHNESVSSKRNELGNKNSQDKVGPYVVKGIRARIISHYKFLIDYFVRENL